MKFDVLGSRWIVTFENMFFVIYDVEIENNLMHYHMSHEKTSIVDFNFIVNRRNSGVFPVKFTFCPRNFSPHSSFSIVSLYMEST